MANASEIRIKDRIRAPGVLRESKTRSAESLLVRVPQIAGNGRRVKTNARASEPTSALSLELAGLAGPALAFSKSATGHREGKGVT